MIYEKTHFGLELQNNQTENVSEDFWLEMFQWSFLKVFAIITGLLTSFGLYPIMLNIIEYNNNRHIR